MRLSYFLDLAVFKYLASVQILHGVRVEAWISTLQSKIDSFGVPAPKMDWDFPPGINKVFWFWFTELTWSVAMFQTARGADVLRTPAGETWARQVQLPSIMYRRERTGHF